MVSHHLNASGCLNGLLRYELAAVRCYQFAEHALDGNATLAELRRGHEAVADLLRGRIAGAGQSPSADPGLWGVLHTLVETSAAVFGRREMLTVLLWVERHAAETYEAGGTDDVADLVLPLIRHHAGLLEPLIAATPERPAAPCAAFPRAGEEVVGCP